jgi:hypothetical protein
MSMIFSAADVNPSDFFSMGAAWMLTPLAGAQKEPLLPALIRKK